MVTQWKYDSLKYTLRESHLAIECERSLSATLKRFNILHGLKNKSSGLGG